LKYATAPDPSGLAVKYVQPIASLNVNPNPVAIGQTVNISISLLPKPPTVSDRFSNVTLSITNPDGTNCNLGPFLPDPNGMVYTSYVPTQIGSYSLKVMYPGQLFPTNNATYLPTQSNIATLNVQQELVSPSPTSSPTLSLTQTPTSTPSQATPTPHANLQTSNNVPTQQNDDNTYITDSSGSLQVQKPQHNGEQGSFSLAEVAKGLVIAFFVCATVLLIIKKIGA
jgi:hypothetical protein